MKQFLIFLGGFISGILVTILVLIVITNASIENDNMVDLPDNQVDIQYIEVNRKNGNVMLHTGMHKDSVKILLGKPDKANLNMIGNSTHEDWEYLKIEKYGLETPDLHISFEDGQLKSVHQY